MNLTNTQLTFEPGRIDTENLYEIINDIPGLKVKDVWFCAPIYYPIAEVSVNYSERNFEDFESIEQLLLNLYNLGVTNPMTLSKTLGIPVNYIKQTLKVLEGYGFIDQKTEKVTKSGAFSLKKGRKIYTSDVEQIFQLDLLNKQLLRIEDRIRNNNLKVLNKTYKEGSTYNEKGHLDFNDNTDEKKILKQLNNDFDNLVERSTEALRKIPERFKKITPVSGFKYADSYMLLIKGFDNPIVVAKRYNPASAKKHSVFKPLGVNKSEETKLLGLNGLNVNTVETTNYIIRLFNLLTEQTLSQPVELKELHQVYPFNPKGIVKINGSGFKDEVQIDHTFFKDYDPYIIKIITRLVEDREFLVVRPKLYGQLLSLRTIDQELFDLYFYYKQGIQKLGSKRLLMIQIATQIDKNKPVIAEIIRILNRIISC